jgi:hypothetical protein
VSNGVSAVEYPLSEVEFAALKQLSRSFARGTIGGAISSRLIRLGYVKDFMSNLIITESGLLRLAMGNGRGEFR